MIALLLLACAGPSPGFSFDGVDDHVRVPSAAGFDGPALSVQVWVTPGAALADRGNLLARRSERGDCFLFRLRGDAGGVLELGLGGGGAEWGLRGRTPIEPGRPRVVAFTHERASGQVRLYVDGVPDAEGTATVPATLGADLPLWIGGDPRHGPRARPFRGVVHAVGAWARVLDGAELAADAAAGAPLSAGAVLAWTGEALPAEWIPGARVEADSADPAWVSR